MDEIAEVNQNEGHKKLLEIARKRFRLTEESEQKTRELALDDLEFRAGKQWPEENRRDRDLDGRPCLVINRIPQFIRQVTNEQRQNRPSIKVSPVDDGGDVETAKIFQGLIRHIEYNSNADVAYDTAFDGAATKGLGYFRIITDYSSPTSFDQDILIKRIRNSFSVYFDPFSKEPDGSDATFAFVVEDVSKESYVEQYPESKLASMSDWAAIGNNIPGWANGESCRVSEYFWKEFKKTKLALLDSGEVTELDDSNYELLRDKIISTRESRIPVIKWAKINALEVLEETVWPGQWIPIVPVYGEELDINGERVLEGIVRHAKDSQRMYNYWASSETESIALSPKAPWVGAAGQFEGFESQWKNANRKTLAYLEYNQITLNGQPAPPPQRNVFEPAVQAITNARLQASEDLKATTGIYDAALGARSNESSGIAIQRRAMQAQTSNFHLIDNLRRSLRHAGRIVVDLIPKIYDTARALRTIGEDGQEEIVLINQMFTKNGEEKIIDFSRGKYDVTVEVGPSFATKRQEAVASIMDFLKAYPLAAQYVGDLLAKNMDWPGASEISERLRKMLPPGVVEDKDKKPIPQEIQQQLSQMNQLIDQLTTQLNEKTKIIEMKSVEIESKERIEMAKIQRDIELKLAELGSIEGLELLKQEVSQIEKRLNILGQSEPIDFIPNDAGPTEAFASSDQSMPIGGQITPSNNVGEVP